MVATAVSIQLTRLEQLAYTETYEEVHKLLCKVVHSFVRCYGLPFDELMGEANYAFARALRRHRKPENRHKKFSTMVYFMATMRLKTYVKKLNKHRNHSELNEEICGSEDHNSFLATLRGELTSDASAVVDLLVESNEDMQLMLRISGMPRSAHGVKRVLREHLMDLGWEKGRVEQTFDELRQIFS
jgi:hypothetical protein